MSGIPVLFSTYCKVPVTVTSDEPSLSKVVGVQVKLATSIASGSGHESNGIHPKSSPPLPGFISILTSPHCAAFAPNTAYPLPVHEPPVYPETNLAGKPANLAIVTNTVVYSEQVPSLARFRKS